MASRQVSQYAIRVSDLKARKRRYNWTMLRGTKKRFSGVPVLMRTLDIIEFLRESDSPLRMREISNATGISPSTTYRVLWTLVRRGYVVRDIEGRFSLLNRPEINIPQIEPGLRRLLTTEWGRRPT